MVLEWSSGLEGHSRTAITTGVHLPIEKLHAVADAEGNTRLNQPPFGGQSKGPSQSTNSGDASVFTADWGAGRVVGHFDRNTFFNLTGAGTNINRFDNQQYAVNLFTYLAGERIPGDYDGNCTVDTLDYAAWIVAFGSTSNLDSDGNGHGIVDAADYTVWRDNFGNQC